MYSGDDKNYILLQIWSGTLGCPAMVLDPSKSIATTSAPGPIENDYALCVVVSNHLVAIGYNSGHVSLYQNGVTYGEAGLIATWKAHASSVRTACFLKSDDNQYKKDLVTGSDDRKIIHWSLNGVCGGSAKRPVAKRSFAGHTDGITCVRNKEAFVLSTSKDCTVRVWNAIMFDDDDDNNDGRSSGQTDTTVAVKSVSTLYGHTGIVTCCDLSPCETKAISCGHDRVYTNCFVFFLYSPHTCLLFRELEAGLPLKLQFSKSNLDFLFPCFFVETFPLSRVSSGAGKAGKAGERVVFQKKAGKAGKKIIALNAFTA